MTAGHIRREHDEEHGRVEAAELRGEVLVVRGPPLRGRAGAHHAAGAGQEPPPWPWERRWLEINKRRQWRSIVVVVVGSAPAAAAAVDVVLRRPLQLQAAQLEMQVRRGLASLHGMHPSMDRSQRVTRLVLQCDNDRSMDGSSCLHC